MYLPNYPSAILSQDSSLEILNCLFEEQDFAIDANGPLTITDSTFRHCNWAFLRSSGPLWMLGNLFVDCGPYYWVDRYYSTSTKDPYPYCRQTRSIVLSGSVHLYRNTFVEIQSTLASITIVIRPSPICLPPSRSILLPRAGSSATSSSVSPVPRSRRPHRSRRRERRLGRFGAVSGRRNWRRDQHQREHLRGADLLRSTQW